MQTYEKYKDSGVEWIGEIPNSWKIMPLKRIGNLGKGLTFTKSDIIDCGNAVISYGQIHSKINSGTKINEYLIRHIPNELIQNYDESLTTKGDFIFADTSEDLEGCGNCVYIDNNNYSIYGGYHTIVLRTRNDENEYLSYLFKTDYWRSQIRSRVSGVKVYSITQGILSLTTICIPPIREQQCIATYLDKKCADIDKVIATQQRRIELLQELKQSTITHAVTRGINPNVKMKDSGVEWIGEVPEHWEITKVSNVCNVVTDFVASGSFADLAKNVTYLDEPDYAMLIRTADLSQKNKSVSKVYINKASYDFLSNSNLFGGEIVLPNIGASIGDVYMIEKKMYEKMSLAPNSIMLKTKYHDKFYYYLFKSKPGRESLQLIGQASAQGKFNKTELRKLRVLIPPITEQIEIVKAIEKALQPLDASISKAQKEIDLLQEYKQALITEVVTGKRKVC